MLAQAAFNSGSSADKSQGEAVIVGLGATGISCARYFKQLARGFRVVDSRATPPALDQFRDEFPDASVHLGADWVDHLLPATELVVSPGVASDQPAINAAREQGVLITGDVDIFAKSVSTPIAAVTGSNGKSTVCAMLSQILAEAGMDFALGGNLDGALFKPVLDLLREPPRSLYLLEVSSFQLETTESLGAEVATVLNLSEDHLDRHHDMAGYARAKHRIFRGARHVLVNRDDPASMPPGTDSTAPMLSFGLDEPTGNQLGMRGSKTGRELVFGEHKIIAESDLKVFGEHNLRNALAAAGLALLLKVEIAPIAKALAAFTGLAHRCQWVAERDGIAFYNDSKATNVAAANASILGLADRISGKVIVILGGQSKSDNFDGLTAAVNRSRLLVLIGRDAELLAGKLPGATDRVFAEDMPDAIRKALSAARSGDAVLLAPACASFDMFENFQDRGRAFVNAVGELS